MKTGKTLSGLDLDFAVFNLAVNLLPDNTFVNTRVRPRIARLFGLRCGRGCEIRKNIHFEGHRRIVLGDGVCLNRESYIDAGGGIVVGDNVKFGPGAMLIAGTHLIGKPEMRMGGVLSKTILIEEGCWIGARVTVTAGVTIGRGCVVSAGAVVQRSMPPGHIVAGNPARPVYTLDKASEKDQAPPPV